MWVRLDDGFADHPKIVAAGPIAAIIQVRALCYAGRFLTDGFLPLAAVPTLLAGLEHIGIEYATACEGMVGFVDEAKAVDWPARLVEHGLWEVVDGGYRIHDYLDYNPARRDVEKARREKAQAGKRGGLSKWGPAAQASNRDRAHRLREAKALGSHSLAEWQEMVNVYERTCLKCRTVRPLVRDHVVPLYQGGSDLITNIQPLCRPCNSSKGPDVTDHRRTDDRTLAKWLADASPLLDPLTGSKRLARPPTPSPSSEKKDPPPTSPGQATGTETVLSHTRPEDDAELRAAREDALAKISRIGHGPR